MSFEPAGVYESANLGVPVDRMNRKNVSINKRASFFQTGSLSLYTLTCTSFWDNTQVFGAYDGGRGIKQ